jgi:4-aminobutyrate aminotransferase-like enzyme
MIVQPDNTPYEKLAAETLRNDPRVAEALRLIRQAVHERQQTLTGVRPPQAERRVGYGQLLDRFAAARGGGLFYPYIGSGLGRGPLVELADGSVKFDMIGGIGVHIMGHGHPTLLAAGLDAALADTVMQGNLQQNVDSALLLDCLLDAVAATGAELPHCFLSTSGAMANENAVKIALQKKHPADRVLAFERCFMGRTLAMASITDKPAYRDGLPLALAVDYVPFFDAAAPADSTQRAVTVLKGHLARHPGRHAVMCLELVQGEGGCNPGSPAFFAAIVAVLREAGVAVFVDEVQTFGRLERLFAFEQFGLAEHVDLVTIGKLSQVCATFFRDSFTPRPGLLSQTFTAATSAIFAGHAVVKELQTGNYYGPNGRIAAIHRRFVSHFEAIAHRHRGLISGPFGTGGMIAFRAFDGDAARTRRLLAALFEAGVIAFAAGATPTRVRFLPPVAAISDNDIDTVCKLLEQVLLAEASRPSEAGQ